MSVTTNEHLNQSLSVSPTCGAHLEVPTPAVNHAGVTAATQPVRSDRPVAHGQHVGRIVCPPFGETDRPPGGGTHREAPDEHWVAGRSGGRRHRGRRGEALPCTARGYRHRGGSVRLPLRCGRCGVEHGDAPHGGIGLVGGVT